MKMDSSNRKKIHLVESTLLCVFNCQLSRGSSVSEIRRTRRTCQANFRNVRKRAAFKFNQMSGELKTKNVRRSQKSFRAGSTVFVLDFHWRFGGKLFRIQ